MSFGLFVRVFVYDFFTYCGNIKYVVNYIQGGPKSKPLPTYHGSGLQRRGGSWRSNGIEEGSKVIRRQSTRLDTAWLTK